MVHSDFTGSAVTEVYMFLSAVPTLGHKCLSSPGSHLEWLDQLNGAIVITSSHSYSQGS